MHDARRTMDDTRRQTKTNYKTSKKKKSLLLKYFEFNAVLKIIRIKIEIREYCYRKSE